MVPMMALLRGMPAASGASVEVVLEVGGPDYVGHDAGVVAEEKGSVSLLLVGFVKLAMGEGGVEGGGFTL
jgi:hypothetical protein